MIDVAKLRKVHALTTSPNQHEAAVAWGKVDAILAREGKGRADLPRLLAPQNGGAAFSPDLGNIPPWMRGFRPDPDIVSAVDAAIRAARTPRNQRRPEDHPDGRVGFLFTNRHRLTEREMLDLSALAAGHRRLNRKQAATAAYLVQQVQRRRAQGTQPKEARHD